MTERHAEILFKGEPAGHLRETAGGGTLFAYAPGWPSAIACCLPVSRREHEWATGLHPFFQHLGPEGWLRERQARVGHIAQEDDLGLLLQYGADCIGAVSMRSPGEPRATAYEPVTELTANPGRTISGVQRKLLVTKRQGAFHPAGPTGLAPFIAKFNSQDVPTLVRNEFLSLRLAVAVLGAREVTRFELGQVAELDETALIVTRFDRAPDGSKLRLEDCAQILCKPRGWDYSGKYEGSYEDIAAVIREHSVRPTIDLARFFRRLVFFAILGNCDAHLKNFSLLETPAGLRLSPAYDIVNTALYDGYDRRLALSLGGDFTQLDDISRALFAQFGLRIGLSQRAVEQSFADMRRRFRRAASLLEAPAGEGPEGFITRYSEIVSRTCLNILDQ